MSLQLHCFRCDKRIKGGNKKKIRFAYLRSLDDVNPEERDIMVKQADMKKHLTVTEVDGRPT